jgi:hypothetical protein
LSPKISYLVPRVYHRHGARVFAPKKVQPGVILVSSMRDMPEGWRRGVRPLNDVEPLSPSMGDDYSLFEVGALLVTKEAATIPLANAR